MIVFHHRATDELRRSRHAPRPPAPPEGAGIESRGRRSGLHRARGQKWGTKGTQALGDRAAHPLYSDRTPTGRELEPILWQFRRDSRVPYPRTSCLSLRGRALRESRIARRRERLADDFCDAQPRVAWLQRTAVYELERMAIGALVALQDRDGFALDLGVVEEVEHLALTCIVRSPLPVVEGVASLRFGKPRWNLANQREASSLCGAARQSARGASGTAE